MSKGSDPVISLGRRSKSALLWGAVEIFLRQGVGFIFSIFLARLLAPEDFGVIGMLSIFIAVAGVFVDSGFSSALIQRKDPTARELSSVFFFNVLMASVAAGVLVGLAPWIADFFRMPILKPLTWLMAFNLFLGSLRSIHVTLLTKRLDFRKQMRATVLASVISGAVGVFLAWRGWGVWSLAWQTVVATLVSTVVLWWICAWRPTLTFSFAALRSLFRFGSFMFLSGLLESAYSRLHVAVIGRLYSARDLGLYTRADATQQLPVTTISGLLGRVAFPVFVAAADDQVVLRRAIRKALTVITLLNAPMMLGLLAVSRPLVMCLFGEKWLPCVPYLQVFCLSGVFYPWHVINLQVIKSVGRSDLFFRLEVIKKVLGLTALLVAAPLGVLAMVWSRPIVSLLCYFVNAYYTGRLACYPAGRQIRDMGSALVAASVMLALVWPITTLGWTPAILTLGIQVMAGVTIFSGLCLLCRIESAGYVLAEAKEFWRRRSRPATIVPAGTKNA